MELERGFQIEDPAVLVPWGVSEAELVGSLPIAARGVTAGYHTIECVSLTGLRHMLGFHFRPRVDGVLSELEFFRSGYDDLRASFDEFQRHLVATFGQPTAVHPAQAGFDRYEWRLGGVGIRHFVVDRFGPEEHVRIAPT